jgi:hypothetical protein
VWQQAIPLVAADCEPFLSPWIGAGALHKIMLRMPVEFDALELERRKRPSHHREKAAVQLSQMWRLMFGHYRLS